MQYTEEYIIENADTFDWNLFQCDMNFYSQDFADQFKSEIQIYVWKNSEGKLHREDGPAIEFADGTKLWYLNGQYHRIDGPAIEFADGDKEWYLHGKLHREDGPAIEYTNGKKEWFLNRSQISEEDFNKWNTRKNIS